VDACPNRGTYEGEACLMSIYLLLGLKFASTASFLSSVVSDLVGLELSEIYMHVEHCVGDWAGGSLCLPGLMKPVEPTSWLAILRYSTLEGIFPCSYNVFV
jgi:hypothetical protein